MSNLDDFLDKKVSELVHRNDVKLSDGEKERHRIYSLGLMSLMFHNWRDLKRGRKATYNWQVDRKTNNNKHLDDDYTGHNIAAIAVDRNGRVIDFEFNHNSIFNSSAEHAEARLIKRIYELSTIQQSWELSNDIAKERNAYNTFDEVTIYTSLESCSQCSGMMTLARVKEVVFLQNDPGMYKIGNILRNLTEKTFIEAPNPIPGSAFDFEYFSNFDKALGHYNQNVSKKPYAEYKVNGEIKKENYSSITSFLTTDLTFNIYKEAYKEFYDYKSGNKILKHPEFKRVLTDEKSGKPIGKTELTNDMSLKEVINFYDYAVLNGKRATPHR